MSNSPSLLGLFQCVSFSTSSPFLFPSPLSSLVFFPSPPLSFSFLYLPPFSFSLSPFSCLPSFSQFPLPSPLSSSLLSFPLIFLFLFPLSSLVFSPSFSYLPRSLPSLFSFLSLPLLPSLPIVSYLPPSPSPSLLSSLVFSPSSLYLYLPPSLPRPLSRLLSLLPLSLSSAFSSPSLLSLPSISVFLLLFPVPVSYTHLTLPTRRTV